MKTHRLIFLLVMIFSSLFISFITEGQNNYEDVVYLKNGGIIHGMIIEQVPNVSLKIQTADRNVFVYKIDEIAKITKEPLPTRTQRVSKPANQVTNLPNEASNPENKALNVASDKVKQKGLSVILQMDNDRYDFAQNETTLATGFRTAIGYQFNPYISLQAGNGIELTSDFIMMPVFADIRFNFLNKPVTPYISTGGGYSFVFHNHYETYPGGYDEYKGGMLLYANLGLKISLGPNVALNFSLGYKYQEYQAINYIVYSMDDPNFINTYNKNAFKFFNFSTGVSF